MSIFVKTLTGKKLHCKVHTWTTVVGVKEMIEALEGISVDWQRLIFTGKQIEDSGEIVDYGIPKESTLRLVLRLRGRNCGCKNNTEDTYLTLQIHSHTGLEFSMHQRASNRHNRAPEGHDRRTRWTAGQVPETAVRWEGFAEGGHHWRSRR